MGTADGEGEIEGNGATTRPHREFPDAGTVTDPCAKLHAVKVSEGSVS